MRRLCWLLIAITTVLVAPTAAASVRSASPVSDTDRERYSLVDVTEPETLRPATLRHVQDLRRNYGLRADAAFVRRLHEHPARFEAVRSDRGIWASLVVTPYELPRLRTRSDVEAGAHAYASKLNEMLGTSNAGTFVDGNRYVVQCAHCDVDDVNARLDALGLPEFFRDSLLVREVRYSLADLETAHEETIRVLAGTSLRTDGSGSNWMKNRVEVYVGRSSERQVRQRLREEFAPSLVAAVRVPGVSERPGGGFRSHGPPTWFEAARTDGDRRLVVSFTGAAPVTDPDDSCQYDYRADAVEGADVVRVTVRPVYRHAHREPVMCADVGYGRIARVTLRQPLGTRRLVDGATGDQVLVFDGSTLLEPGWLPVGWDPRSEFGSVLDQPESSWTRAFGVSKDRLQECSRTADGVRLIQGPPGAVEKVLAQWQYPTVSTLEVRGHLAEFGVDPRTQSTVLRWQEAGQQIVLDGASGCGGVPGVDLDTLTRIAQGLR